MIKKKLCNNCESAEHSLNECPLPLCSYGIINIKFTGDIKKYQDIIKKDLSNKENVLNIERFINDPEKIKLIDPNVLKQVRENLLFLMVSRKNSLGYIDFIRGKYDKDNFREIKYLFEQMTEIEIKNIITKSFNFLWNDIWKKSAYKQSFKENAIISQEKFDYVLKYYNLESIKPLFPFPEWGFPKGRKNYNEEDINSAKRECREETGLTDSEINVLESIEIFQELLTGTDGKRYKHIYYLSIVSKERYLHYNNKNNHFVEIEDIGWFNINNLMTLIRSYHVRKIEIIKNIINYISYYISRINIKEL